MIVLINDVEEPYAHNSIDIDDAIGQRSTASFTIVDKIGDKRFKKGQNVKILETTHEGLENQLRAEGGFLTPGNWVGDFTIEAGYISDGSFKVDNSTGTTAKQVENVERSLKPKKYYLIGIWAKAVAGSPKITLGVNGYSPMGGQVTHFRKEFTLTNDWAYYTFKFIASPTYDQLVSVNQYYSADISHYNPFLAVESFGTANDVALFNAMSIYEVTDTIYNKINVHPSYTGAALYEEFPYSETVLVFGGVIDRPVAKYMSLASNAKFHGITCADWHYFADKRIIAKVYREMYAGDIVRDIIANYLAAEGITAGDIQPGPLITEAIFNYVPTTDAFESLGEKSGFEWQIDQDKVFNFFSRSTFAAPHNITEVSDIKNVEVEPAAEDYRNKQYIRAGKDITDPQTKEFTGDGKNKSFVFPYELALEPIIKVNGVTQTVGIRGLEEGMQWYWNKGDKIISQDDGGTPLNNTQTLQIIGQGYFDIVVVSYDQTAIDEMQTIEGGSGIHEDVLDDPYLTSRSSAFESASAKLRRYAKIGNRVTFDTKLTGLRAGQLINIDLPTHGINQTDFLIESIKAAELGTTDGRLIYQVSAVDGAATGGWANFFKKMATRGQAFVIRENIQENEILIVLDTFSKTWTEAENPNIFRKLYPSATLYPGPTVYPSFEDVNRVKYLSFFDASNVEIFRKSIQKKTETTPGELVSTTLILPYEANGLPIAYVGWFGGIGATAALNTGILIDKQPYNKEKTDMESIQIDKIDLKGW